MKSILLIFVLLFNFTCLKAQETLLSDQTAMHKTVTGFFDALAELDGKKAKSFCTPDITILESGKVWNMDSLTLRITSRKAKAAGFKRVNKLDFFETKKFGDIAWVSYFNEAEIRFENKTTNIKWLESAVLKNENGKWKINLLHSTKLEPAE